MPLSGMDKVPFSEMRGGNFHQGPRNVSLIRATGTVKRHYKTSTLTWKTAAGPQGCWLRTQLLHKMLMCMCALQAGNKSLLTFRSDIGIPGYTGYAPGWCTVPIPITGSTVHTGKLPDDAHLHEVTIQTEQWHAESE